MTEDITLKQRTDPSISESELVEASNAANEPNTLYNFATHNPFADEQDTMSDFFDGSDRTEQLDETIHLCQFGNNIALVTGDGGIGKTYFLEQACFELSETASCCFISGSMDLTSEAIAKDVSTELSMPFATSQTIEQLIDMLDDADALKDVSRFIIIVDDIHLLSEDIIFSLLHLSQLSSSVFHLLASGLPSTLNYLESLEFQEGLIKEVYLLPYSREETHDYLNFKMNAAGYKGENFFDIETVTQLYKSSAGYPSKINKVAERYLLNQGQEFAEQSNETRSLGLPLWHMVGLVFLIFALILAFFYRSSDNIESTEQTIPITFENKINTAPEPQSPKADTQKTTAPTEQVQLSANAPVDASPQAVISIPTTNNEKDTAIQPQEPDPVTATPLEVISNTVLETPNTTTEPPAVEEKITNNQDADTNSTIAVASEKIAPTESTKQATLQSSLSANEQEVLNWPENDSTIQIIGALDKASLEQYLSAQANKESLRLITVVRNNQPWHIVLAGHYANNNQAREAIQKLPQNQVNSGPWIRKVSELKQGIRDFRR